MQTAGGLFPFGSVIKMVVKSTACSLQNGQQVGCDKDKEPRPQISSLP